MPISTLLLMSATDQGRFPYGHPFPENVPLLCKILLDAGFEVQLGTNLDRVRNSDPEHGIFPFDVVIILGRFRGRDRDAERRLVEYVDGGKGLVVIHIASSSFPGSAAWNELVGRIWLYEEDYPDRSITPSDHPKPGEFTVSVADPNHPVMEGVQDFRVHDELYYGLGIAPGAQEHVLATATTTEHEDKEPMAFTLRHGKGRVFHTTLGHGPSTFNNPTFQKMLLQGIEWTASR